MNKNLFLMPAAVLLLSAGCATTESLDGARCYGSAEAAVPDSLPAPRNMARARSAGMAKGSARNNFRAPAGHQMTFTAHLRLSVGNVRDAVDQARNIAMKSGGYVKRMDDYSVTLAIPVAKAEDVLEELKKSGVLLSLRIEGEDVTQQVTDLAVRLENLEKSRKRLLALLEKAGKVEEMVKVETAITRVTTELERLQAQQKNLHGRIAYVTMYVNYVAAAVKQIPHNTSPVGWINALGSNLLAFDQRIVNNDDSLIIDLKLPAGFVKNGSSGAVSGNYCVLELESYVNAVTATHWYGNDYASIDFYVPMIQTALAERFKVPVAVARCKIDGYDAAVYTVKPVIGGISYTYRVAVAVVKSKVKVIIARGKSVNIEKTLPESAWKTMLDSVSF